MWLRVVSGTLMSVSAVTAAALFKDVRAVLVGQVGISAVTCIVLFAALARATPLPLRPAFDGPTFRAMRGYAGLVFATGVAYQAMLQGPPTVLAGVARAAELTAFAVPAMVLQQLTVLVTSTSTAFMPFASAESAGDDLSHLSMVFRSHMRLTLMAMGPVAGFLVVFASPLLTAWVGADFASHASDPLKLLAVAGLVLALSAPASDVARGLGRPGWTLAYSGCAALVAIAAALVLADRRGAAGAAASLLIALTVTTVPFVLATADRLLAQSPGRLLKSILRPALAAAVACAMFGLGSFVTSGLIGAAAVGVLVIAVYVVAVYRLVLEDLERETLRAGASPLSPVIRALTRVSPRASGTRAG
jgi:O-antigen/teichoic acid export membrane protein